MDKFLLGCDWGTSTFRLGLYNITRGVLVHEIHSGDGISSIHRAWQNGHQPSAAAKDQMFRAQLSAQIKILSGRAGFHLANTPIVISGMASSSIGMEAVAYARLPFNMDGSQVIIRRFAAQDNFPHEILLISGVQSDDDAMRGEETQLIGIWSLLGDLGTRTKEAVVIFPGTHSKHIYVKNDQILRFKTFMTGEIYQVVGNHSILKDAVMMVDNKPFSPALAQAFTAGIKEAGQSSLLNALFTVRTNDLFKKLNKTENAFYLSGLLIGNELNDLVKEPGQPVFLCGGNNLHGLYRLALEALDLAGRATFVPPGLVESAAITGQRIIYEQYINNKLLNE
ncbi:MAG: 2-dehydro-3-deoxygalactonokinase [Chitinophagaceae bacterium]